MFAIFTIKFIFIGLMFLNQACSDDLNYEDGISPNKIESQKFINSVKIANEKIKNSSILSYHEQQNNLSNEFKTDSLSSEDEPTEEEAQEILKPVVNDGVALLKSFGVTEEEIINEFGSLDSPDIATAALAVHRINDMSQMSYFVKELNDDDYVYNDFSFITTSAYAQTGNVYLDCALVAVGVDTIVEYFQGKIKSLGKKGVLKIIRKVATRTLGWVGAAVTVYAYVSCLNENRITTENT